MDHQNWIPGLGSRAAISRINGLLSILICLAINFSINGIATAQTTSTGCGPIDGGADYRGAEQGYLKQVEDFHFTPSVESLIHGHTGTIGSDLDYTLSHFPNHHRALIAMMRLGEKEKTSQPGGSKYSVECWFDRAVRFRPDDVIVRMIYSTYLNKQGRRADAASQLGIATTYAKDDAFAHYNIGLHYFDLKNYDQALIEAHKAIALGFAQTALRDKLQSVGKWTEPANKTTFPATDATPASEAK